MLVGGHYYSRRGEGWHQNLIRKLLFSMIGEFITYSERDKEVIDKAWPGKEALVAHNSIYSRSEFPDPAPLTDCRDIIFTGRLIKAKRVDLLLNAWRLVLRNNRDIGVLHLVGSGPEQEALVRTCYELEIEDHVIFHGHNKDIDFLGTLYSSSFCSVSPGYVGLMAFQSHAFGRPILVSPGEPNSPEFHMCVPGENAAYFDSGSEESLAGVIATVFDSRDSWNSKANTIQETCLRQYSIEAMVIPFVEFALK